MLLIRAWEVKAGVRGQGSRTAWGPAHWRRPWGWGAFLPPPPRPPPPRTSTEEPAARLHTYVALRTGCLLPVCLSKSRSLKNLLPEEEERKWPRCGPRHRAARSMRRRRRARRPPLPRTRVRPVARERPRGEHPARSSASWAAHLLPCPPASWRLTRLITLNQRRTDPMIFTSSSLMYCSAVYQSLSNIDSLLNEPSPLCTMSNN